MRAVLCVCVVVGVACDQPPPPSKPIQLAPVTLPVGSAPQGLIIITADTLRADYLSCYGHTRILTPNLDRLAVGGQLFKNAISQSTTTTPSHASLFTSLYLHDHNVYSNFEALGDAPQTLAELFFDNGFATFSVVNMRHLNPEIGNFDQGVDTYLKSANMRRAGPTIDAFLDWLDRLQQAPTSKPFYAWLHFADVHTPYRPPPPYDRFYYDDDERDPHKRSLARIWNLLPQHMTDHPNFLRWLDGITDLYWVYAQYQGAVTYVDDEVGRLMEALIERKLLDRTAIVFTADHGESLGDHDMYFVHTGLYESTVHVPLITYFPGAERQGVQVDEVVESVDVLPTLLEYFELKPPDGIRGRSLWPLIRGKVLPAKMALTEHAGRSMVALRSDRYKYIVHLRDSHHQPAYPFSKGREELYDLVDDPLELRDLSGTRPELLLPFRTELAHRRDDKLALQTGDAELTADTVEVLRSLGYVK